MGIADGLLDAAARAWEVWRARVLGFVLSALSAPPERRAMSVSGGR